MISVSKRAFYATIIIASVGTALASFLEGTVVPLLVAPISVPLVLTVPGLLAYMGLQRCNQITLRGVLYATGLSASLLMLFGFVINVPYQITGTELIRRTPIWIGFGILLFVLGRWSNRRISENFIDLPVATEAKPYAMGSIGIASATGAIIIEGGGPNEFVLLALALIFLLYAVGVFKPKHRGLLLYALALGLLLHNTLGSEFLLWGDQPKEANIAYTVLQVGHWTPQELPKANKATMLRISILHPVHVLLTGLELKFVFKVLHPVLFAITPVAIYQTFADRGRAQAGYIGAGAFMFSFPFITVLSRNTRTAGAIMFMVLFLYAILDMDSPALVRRVLIPVFGTSVFVCHYGSGYMFAAMLGGGFFLAMLGRRILGQDEWRHDVIPAVPLLLTGTMAISWYTYISPGSKSLMTLVGFLVRFTAKLQEGFFQPSNSATTNYATTNLSSLSLSGVRILTIILFLFIGIGWLVALLRTRKQLVKVESSASYLALAAFAGALVGITFLPIERFNTARTMMFSLAIVSPLLLIGAEGIVHTLDVRRMMPTWAPALLCLLLLLPYFVFASGLLAATVTNDYSPNTLVYRDDVTREGSFEAKEYLYKQFNPNTGTKGSQWLQRYGKGDVYGSRWPGNPNPGSMEAKAIPYRHGIQYHGNISKMGPGSCAYLGPFSVDAGVIKLPSSHFGNAYLATSEFNTEYLSQVYSNGGAAYYCSVQKH